MCRSAVPSLGVTLEHVAREFQEALFPQVDLKVRLWFIVGTAEEVVGHLYQETNVPRVDGGGDDGETIALHGRDPGVVVTAALGYVAEYPLPVAHCRVGEVIGYVHYRVKAWLTTNYSPKPHYLQPYSAALILNSLQK